MMQFKLVQYKDNLFTDFWAIPLFLSLCAVILAFICLYLDRLNILFETKQYLSQYINVENANTTLSIIATSVISITSVTFSVTVLILSINSNQLGQLLLPNFMKQKSTQIVLGLFIGTYIYMLIVLHNMPISETSANIAYISVSVGLTLGIISFFTLIYFIYFVCHVIQLDNVLTFLTLDLIHSIDTQLPDKTDANESANEAIEPADENIIEQEKYPSSKQLASHTWGYIQTIDYDHLVTLAEEHDCLIQLPVRTGQFITSKLPLMTIYSRSKLDNAIENDLLSTVHVGRRRSTVQDIEYGFEQINEIAIRALSPGINAPYTAIHCLDKIFEVFVKLSEKTTLSSVVYNEKAKPRLIRKVSKYNNIIDLALNRLRQACRSDLAVSIHLLQLIDRIFQIDLPNSLKRALIKQADMLFQDIDRQALNKADAHDLQQSYQQINVES